MNPRTSPVRAGRRTAAKQSAAPLATRQGGTPIMRAGAQPINSCPRCGAMYTGNSHVCWPGRGRAS